MGKEDFNKGMEAGARPFEEKYREIGEQFQEISGKMERDMDKIKETNEAILNEMDSFQKKQFYKDNTIVDIDILEKGDRETLLSCLFTLSATEKQLTNLQQLFIRSVKKYLERDVEKRPENWSILKEGSWLIIETITGVEETKAVAQALMEFLFLGYEDHEKYLHKYKELFECFNLNKKGFEEIKIHISNLYHSTGLEGIAENYGYVPEELNGTDSKEKEKSEVENLYGSVGKLSHLEINKEVVLEVGEEKIYEDKEIFLNNSIELKKYSTLRFKNCCIITDKKYSENYYNLIFAQWEGAKVWFENCTIRHTIEKKTLIDCVDQIFILNCRIESCGAISRGSFSTGPIVTIKKSYITITQKYGCFSSFNGNEIYLNDSKIDEEKSFDENEFSNFMFSSIKQTVIDNCRFKNLDKSKFEIKSEIKNSVFEKCTIGYDHYSHSKYEKGLVINSIFKECIFKDSYLVYRNSEIKFENIEMYDCVGCLPAVELVNVKADRGYLTLYPYRFSNDVCIKLKGCQFLNLSYDDYKDIVENSDDLLSLRIESVMAISGGTLSEIIGCRFENLSINQDFLIGVRKEGDILKIEDCKFINVKTNSGSILRKSWSYRKSGVFKSKIVTGTANMRISNCIGL